MHHWGFTVKIEQKTIYFDNKICDPRISRIEKILAQNCPKFLDLYASICGNLKYCLSLNEQLVILRAVCNSIPNTLILGKI